MLVQLCSKQGVPADMVLKNLRYTTMDPEPNNTYTSTHVRLHFQKVSVLFILWDMNRLLLVGIAKKIKNTQLMKKVERQKIAPFRKAKKNRKQQNKI